MIANVIVVLGYVVYNVFHRNTDPIILSFWTFCASFLYFAVFVPSALPLVFRRWSLIHDYSVVLLLPALGYWVVFWSVLPTEGAGIVLAALSLDIIFAPLLMGTLCDQHAIKRRVLFWLVALILVFGVLILRSDSTLSWGANLAKVGSSTFAILMLVAFCRAAQAFIKTRLTERFDESRYDDHNDEIKETIRFLEAGMDRRGVDEAQRAYVAKQQLQSALSIVTYFWCAVLTGGIAFLTIPGFGFSRLQIEDATFLYIGFFAAAMQEALLQKVYADKNVSHMVTPWSAVRHLFYAAISIAIVQAASLFGWTVGNLKPASLNDLSQGFLVGSVLIIIALYIKYRVDKKSNRSIPPYH